jgi:hypothetical protein
MRPAFVVCQVALVAYCAVGAPAAAQEELELFTDVWQSIVYKLVWDVGQGSLPDEPQPRRDPPPATAARDGVQSQMIQSVVDDLDPSLQIMDRDVPSGPTRWARLGLLARPFTGRPGPARGYGSPFRASLGPLPIETGPPAAPTRPDPADAKRPLQLLLVSLGNSTGEAFTAYVLGEGALPKRLVFDGLVVEPLSPAAQKEAQRLLRRLNGRRGASAKLDAYCLQFRRSPPPKGRVFRVAAQEAQSRHEPSRRILRASERLRDRLHPDSDPAAYFHSIRQWALWTVEQGFDEAAYADAFVGHTRKNVEAARQKWTREMEQVLRGVVPNRWQDIQAILGEAQLH